MSELELHQIEMPALEETESREERNEMENQPDDDKNSENQLEAAESVEKEKCIICFEAIEEDTVLEWPVCAHMFHKECATKWMAKSNNCPLCRTHNGYEQVEQEVHGQELHRELRELFHHLSESLNHPRAVIVEIHLHRRRRRGVRDRDQLRYPMPDSPFSRGSPFRVREADQFRRQRGRRRSPRRMDHFFQPRDHALENIFDHPTGRGNNCFVCGKMISFNLHTLGEQEMCYGCMIQESIKMSAGPEQPPHENSQQAEEPNNNNILNQSDPNHFEINGWCCSIL